MAYPPPPGPYGPYGHRHLPPPPAENNSMAIGALVCGIAAWLVAPLVGAVVAIVLGHLSLRQLRQSDQAGHGMAVAGLVLGYLNLAASLVFVCLFGSAALACIGGALSLDPVPPDEFPDPRISQGPLDSAEPLPTA